MNADLIKAMFAVYVMSVSLVRLMSEHEFFRLTAMKKVWGRSRGLLLHFIANILLPLLLAIYFLCRSIVGPLTFG